MQNIMRYAIYFAPPEYSRRDHFGSLIDGAIDVNSLALFKEPEPGMPFIIRSFHELVPQSARKTT